MKFFSRIALFFLSSVLVACGGGGGGGSSSGTTSTYSVGGTISGLTSGTLIVKNNSGDDITIPANSTSFTLTTLLASGTAYAVTVVTQPNGLTCSLSNGSGSVTNVDITNITLTCAPLTYTVSGIVSGLTTGISATLQVNKSNSTTVTSNGSFTFLTPIANGTTYSVTVSASSLFCSVTNGKGILSGSNVTNVAVSCRPQYAYVTNSSHAISMYSVGSDGALTALSPSTEATTASNCVTRGITINPAGTYAYAINQNGVFCPTSTISMFSIGSNGTLTALSPATVSFGGNSPVTITINPAGTYAYVANNTSNNVSMFSVGNNGILTALNPAAVSAGAVPFGVTISPAGTFAYVPNYSGNTISMYSIGNDGSLTALSTATIPAGSNPNGVTINPSGTYAYASNYNDNTISMYSIGNNGILAPLSTPTVNTGRGPEKMAIHPSGIYAYVPNNTDSTISMYSIANDGTLTTLSTATVSTSPSPLSLTINSDGTFAYVHSQLSNSVSMYAIGSDGILTALNPASLTTTSPRAIVITQ
jgi:6-phosphogluconolactonase (cycloisomerase 2 family)